MQHTSSIHGSMCAMLCNAVAVCDAAVVCNAVAVWHTMAVCVETADHVVQFRWVLGEPVG